MGRTILVADDSPTIRKIVELTFSDTGFRVEAVGGGREALAALEALRPDLVLADVVMPEPAGYELCRTVKASGRAVPVLLLAGTFEPFDAEEARRCGADGHLVKPFESRTLRERVEKRLGDPEPSSRAADRPAGDPDIEDALAAAAEEPSADFADGPPGPADAGAGVEVGPATGPAAELDEALAGPPAPAPLASAAAIPPEWVDAVSREVVRRLSTDVLREIAWDVVPKLAGEIIRERIRELEREVDGD